MELFASVSVIPAHLQCDVIADAMMHRLVVMGAHMYLPWNHRADLVAASVHLPRGPAMEEGT